MLRLLRHHMCAIVGQRCDHIHEELGAAPRQLRLQLGVGDAGRDRHFDLLQYTSVVKVGRVELLHGQACAAVLPRNGPLKGRGASKLRQHRRVQIERVRRIWELLQERRRNSVPERRSEKKRGRRPGHFVRQHEVVETCGRDLQRWQPLCLGKLLDRRHAHALRTPCMLYVGGSQYMQ